MNWEQLLSKTRVRQLYRPGQPTKLPDDTRTEFERDYDRAVFSTPVRRLQDKAQVFPLERHDAIRTRLTHSHEVSSVARGLAGAAAEWMLNKGHIQNTSYVADIKTIASTCGLIHDLGNPPFGHAGEDAIAKWFEKKLKHAKGFFGELGQPTKESAPTQMAQDFLRFNGNAQTQRLLSKLQILADEYGLNLTCGTLSASCKYTARSNEVDKTHGFFASENDLIESIRKETGTSSARNPITFLVEAADDIVYSTVDLEDGVKKGVLTWAMIETELPKRLKDEHNSYRVQNAFEAARKHMSDANLIGRSGDEGLAQAFRTAAIYEAVRCVLDAFTHNYSEIMDGTYVGELVKDSDAAGLVWACKKMGRDYVYVSHETLKLEVLGCRVIHDLMDLFWKAAVEYPYQDMKSFAAKIYHLASDNYRRVFEKNFSSTTTKLPKDYFRMQLVTDQISGMTDTYACDLYKNLTHG